jgi:hypothetical protein
MISTVLLYISIDRHKWPWVDAAHTCIFNTFTGNSINEYDYFLGKTVNSTCRTSQECYGKLVCLKGNCGCSEQHYWHNLVIMTHFWNYLHQVTLKIGRIRQVRLYLVSVIIPIIVRSIPVHREEYLIQNMSYYLSLT